MRIATIGFQKSGKTTVFNALTGQQATTAAYTTGRPTLNQAVVKIPDPRLDRLAELFKPKKNTPATVQYVDAVGFARGEPGGGAEGLGEKMLHEIGTADALLAVICGFEDPALGGAPDPTGDAEAMALELALADLRKVENRLERTEKQIHKLAGKERAAMQLERTVLARLQGALEEGRPARAVELTNDEEKAVRGFQLLTLKPTMYLINENETRWSEHKDAEVDLGGLAAYPATMGTRLCAQTEMEITQLPDEDRTEFLADYGIDEPAAARIIRLCYELLGRISFFTVGADECRAWTVRRGASAPEAAGTIHSDLERGFIRAEVIRWDELLELGSMAEAKKHGKLRTEGKNYEVRDGDVVNVLFST